MFFIAFVVYITWYDTPSSCSIYSTYDLPCCGTFLVEYTQDGETGGDVLLQEPIKSTLRVDVYSTLSREVTFMGLHVDDPAYEEVRSKEIGRGGGRISLK